MYRLVLASQDNNVLTMHCVKLAVSRFLCSVYIFIWFEHFHASFYNARVRKIINICLSGSLNFFNSAYPIEEYPAKTRQAAAIMLMIMNNLDARVAQVYMQLPNHYIFKPA